MKSDFTYRAYFIFFFGIALGFFFLPTSASALTLTPVRFELTGNPGDKLEGEVLLINEGNVAETYYVSYANFEAQGETGSPAFVEPKEGLGTWIRAESASITLGARQQKTMPFAIEIPKDAEPGGYFAVIFWGTSPPTATSGVAIGSKVGALVLLSVPGDVREDAGLLDFQIQDKKFWHSTLPITFEYRFRNDGADRVKPAGKIIIHNSVYWPTEKLDANPVVGNVLPASTRKFSVDWVNYSRPADYAPPSGFFKKFWSDVDYQWKNFAVGFYAARLKLVYGAQNEEARKTVLFFVFPWQLVLVMLVVLFILFWGGKKTIRRYNRFIIEKARANVPSHGQ